MTVETFGPMLRRLRIEAGLSQNALARAAGIDPAYVNRIEAGHPYRPTRLVLLALAEALDLSPGRTDRLLFAGGLAPSENWQSRALAAEAQLDAIRAVLMPLEATLQLVRRPGEGDRRDDDLRAL